MSVDHSDPTLDRTLTGGRPASGFDLDPVMIWLCVFPTLTALNLALGDQLASMSAIVRTFVLAMIAVPIVIYGLMPHLHRARARLLSRRGRP